MERIVTALFEQKDEKYKKFQGGLIPNIHQDTVIGVRTPILRKMAKELAKTESAAAFLQELPHDYYEENQLHAFLLSQEKDFNVLIEKLDEFLPYVDNWSTCDQMNPKIFKKHRTKLIEHAYRWMDSDDTYAIRFGIKVLMDHYLDEDYQPEYLKRVSRIRSQEYYIRMMVAWYFATALAKQPDDALAMIEQKELDVWVQNKAIQKAIESYRVSDELKQHLRNLKIKER